ncbi:hypothetical protein R5R35_010467 [Gryllus longicercus]
MACTRFLGLLAAVAVAAVCIAAVEGRAHGRSVSLRQVDANASASVSANATTNSSSSSAIEDISSAVADNWAALSNATNLSVKNSQDSWNAFVQNPTNLSSIASAQLKTAVDINKDLFDRWNANTAKFFKSLFG